MPTAVENVVEKISTMTAMELSELKKALEDKFGVTAAAPAMAFNPAMMAGMAPAAIAAEEEKSEYDVVLAAIGEKKLDVIKLVREITGLGLKEAKDLVDGAPKPVKQATTKDDAEKIKKQLEEVGAKVELK